MLGIDLGTTKSVVAMCKHDGLHFVEPEPNRRSLPSLVLVTEDGEIAAGHQARRHRDRYRGRSITISSVKRLMGRRGETGWGWWKTYPQEVSAFVLAELKYQAESAFRRSFARAVIAIPSHFDDNQRRATKEAASIAGLEAARLLNEATAAVLAYGQRGRKPGKVLVFDFGGGTLDVSIVDFGDGVYEVLCIEGDTSLGGDDFDSVLCEHGLSQAKKQYGALPELSLTQELVLKETAEQAKRHLSGSQRARLFIPGFLRAGGAHRDLDVQISRTTFESLSSGLLERTASVLDRALGAVSLDPGSLSAVLLLGGTSRIPRVREIVRERVGIGPSTAVSPETCVAEGAAIYGAMLEGQTRNVVLVDVVPRSYGIAVSGNKNSVLIPRNTAIPTSKKEVFTTTEDNQQAITVVVLQGESQDAAGNTRLGTLELRGIPPAAKGTPQVEVSFDVNADMVLSVGAQDLGTGTKRQVEIRAPYGLTEVQARAMRERMASWLVRRRTFGLRQRARTLIDRIPKLLPGGSVVLGAELLSAIRGHQQKLGALIEGDDSYGALEAELPATRSAVELAEQRTADYGKVTQECKSVISCLEGLVAVAQASDPAEAAVLVGGRDLLSRCLSQRLERSALEAQVGSVRTGCVQAAARLLRGATVRMADCEEAKAMSTWPNGPSAALAALAEHSERFRPVAQAAGFPGPLEHARLREQICHACLSQSASHPEAAGVFLLAMAACGVSVAPFTNRARWPDALSREWAIPALFAFLVGRPEAGLREEAIEALADCEPGPRWGTPLLELLLEERGAPGRSMLLKALSRLPPAAVFESIATAGGDVTSKAQADDDLLAELAASPLEEARAFALGGLAKLVGKGVSPALIVLARDRNNVIRREALGILSRSATSTAEAAAVFQEAVWDDSAAITELCLAWVARTRDLACILELVKLLRSDQGRRDREAVLQTVLTCFDTEDDRDRRRQIGVELGGYLVGAGDLAMVVSRLCGETDAEVRGVLLQRVDREPGGALYRFVTRCDDVHRMKALADRDLVLRLAKEPVVEGRLLAAEQMGTFPAEEVLPALLGLVCDDCEEVRARGLRALHDIRATGPEVERVFQGALGDPSSRVRAVALQWVEQARASWCTPQLLAMVLACGDSALEQKARSVLETVSGLAAVPQIVTAAAKEGDRHLERLVLSIITREIALSRSSSRLVDAVLSCVVTGKQSLRFWHRVRLWLIVRRRPCLAATAQALRDISRANRRRRRTGNEQGVG